MSTNGKTLKFRAAKLKGFTVHTLCSGVFVQENRFHVQFQNGSDVKTIHRCHVKLSRSFLTFHFPHWGLHCKSLGYVIF